MHANCGHVNGKVERSRRIDAEEFCRLLDGVVEDDTGLFNQKLKEWGGLLQLPPATRQAWRPNPYERLLQRPGPNLSPANVSHTRSVDAVSTQDSNLRRR